MPTIILSNSDKLVEVDEQDYMFFLLTNWNLAPNGYARMSALPNTPMHIYLAHQMGIQGDVDHKDRNPLNNRRGNLRAATHSNNMSNRTSRNASGYRGVTWHNGNQKYRATIYKGRRCIHLGCFDDPKEAAKAYDKSARLLHGAFAILNFEE